MGADRQRQTTASDAGAESRRVSRRAVVGGLAALGAGALLEPGAARAAADVAETARSKSLAQTDAKTLVFAADGSPSDLDPQTSNDYRSILALLGIYDTLIALKGASTDEYVPMLAEKWESNADKSVWTFHLRDGVKFTDGTPCDAAAVLASFERLSQMALGQGESWTRFVSDPKKQITAPDAKTVVFSLGKPQPLFEAAIAGTYGVYIVNAKAMKDHEDNGDWGHAWAQTNADGTGTGPYKLASFDPSEQLTLEKNDDYWGGWDGNHFERVVIRVVPENGTRRQLLEQGQVDLVDTLTYNDLDALKQNPNLTLHAGYTSRIDYLYLTVAGPLKTPEARQAMNYAFPFDDVIKGVYKGYGKRAIGPVAEVVRGFDPKTFLYPTDLDKAKALFAKAGVEPGTTITMATEPGDQNVLTLAQLFQANLAKIGVTLNITQMETSSYVGMLYGDAPADQRPNLMSWAWWPSYNDGWSHLHDLTACDATGANGGGNAGFYCNQKVDALLKQAESAPDDATYNKAMAELQQILTQDDPPAIYYAQIQTTLMAQKDIQGIVINPINVGTYYFYQMSRAGA
jgi:peptide/nickel transport system substrate-binding protein